MLKYIICNECKSKKQLYIHSSFYGQNGVVGYNFTEKLNGSILPATIINKCKYHKEI
tara:strand:- start:365 stop:535 length:171 start_codon:yes stop_codon:yes gene_type:complete